MLELSRRWLLPLFSLLPLGMAAGCAGPASTAPSPDPGADLDLAANAAAERRTRGPSPLLWRIRAPGGPTSHVLGTIHVGVSAGELHPAVWQALDRAEVFAMETDIEGATHSVRAPAPPAASALDEAQWSVLEELVGARLAAEIGAQPVDVAYGLVLQALFPRSRMAMDLALARSAADLGLELRYLESLEHQLDLAGTYLDGGELSQMLEPGSDLRRELHGLVSAYRRGDLATIEALALDPELAASDPERFAALFSERNRRWTELATPWLRDTSCFIAVGAGHLPGEAGLIALLESRGFQVDRVGVSG